VAFLESSSFEDAIIKAVSLGGDTDTLACITGALAEAYYKKIPIVLLLNAWRRLPAEIRETVVKFRRWVKETDEKYYFGSFSHEVHGIKDVVLWFSNDSKYDYVKVSNKKNDISGTNCFKISLNNYKTTRCFMDSLIVEEIIAFLKKNKSIIMDYNHLKIYDAEFIHRLESMG